MVLFIILALVLTISALGVVAFKNPVLSALSLILNLLCVAALFASLEAHFLAVVQVVVYAGAIMVLVLFILMLLNLKIERPKGMRKTYAALAAGCGALFLSMVVPMVNDLFKVFPTPDNSSAGTVRVMGEILYTKYVFLFEIASVLILAAMIGAVMLAKRSYGEK